MRILVSHEGAERRIALVSDSYALVFKTVSNAQSLKPLCAIELVEKHQLKNEGFKRLSIHDVYGFIGLIDLQGLVFIAAITGKSKAASPIPNETVNKIFAVDFFCLNDSRWDFLEIDSSGRPIVIGSDESEEARSILKHPCQDLRKLLSNGSFYYSSDFDLTSTLQKRGLNNYSLSTDSFEDEYMWNYFLMKEIIEYRDRIDEKTKHILDEEGFLITVIRGFAETFITYVKRLKVALTVISKQSWKRAGTRFNARGIDDEGYVANFVETEIIMYSSEYCYALTQIRGSVPVFWEQDASLMNPKIQITRSLEATQPVFDKHFQRLIENYGPINIINLLSKKPNEIELSKRYRSHLYKSETLEMSNDVFYTEFDFNKETSQEGFSAAKKLLPKIMDSLVEIGYFSYDVKEKKTISMQKGVFRVNCLDCLDRTNLAQQLLSLSALQMFLEDYHLIRPNDYIDESDFSNKHNTLWADHGDQISQIYTGTNALKSSFSRKGKMSLAGALSDATKSVSRRYINNFMDKGKQQNIDTLLGRLPHQEAVQLYDPETEYVQSKLHDLENKFTSKSNMNLFIGTFNINGMSTSSDLSKWLFPIGERFKPDAVILGLQEVIELTAGSILNADYSKKSFWENTVNDCLNQYGEKYILLRVEQMSSLIILLFVRSDKSKYVKRVEGSTKKTGFGGIAGNKGAVAIRFEYEGTSFCFVNSHFSAGVNNVEERTNDYNTINKSITFSGSKRIYHHDSIFWLGDLNFRINLDNEAVKRQLYEKKEGYIENLLQYDQLIQEISEGRIFQGFNEPEIKFHPTYKFDLGTDRYDSSEKARTPSWTDRIVYKGQNVYALAYSDAPLTLSDHKPVYAAYKADVVSIDEAKKEELTKQLYAEVRGKYLKAGPPDATARSKFNIEKDVTNRPPISPLSLPSNRIKNLQQESVRSVPPLPSRSSLSINSLGRENIESKRLAVAPPPPPSRGPSVIIQDGDSIPDLIDLNSSSSSISSRPTPPPSRSSKLHEENASSSRQGQEQKMKSPPPVKPRVQVCESKPKEEESMNASGEHVLPSKISSGTNTPKKIENVIESNGEAISIETLQESRKVPLPPMKPKKLADIKTEKVSENLENRRNAQSSTSLLESTDNANIQANIDVEMSKKISSKSETPNPTVSQQKKHVPPVVPKKKPELSSIKKQPPTIPPRNPNLTK
ncbi:hypothetical protein KAFR_0B04520 [Kazachstania africana CBS 2517]|uniref:phosphoinositide 5-phosphatase n=1 Tax=Kazachstania africana (strain ATCC 22294 / BCRC 22015 / CBS 2517 / CECT 1963 / NBRC 1671 / NRRL Y-8276) TaxID=1071382 RepID=H2AQU9_KAZAF|nr:hypothetical protein KAFR_0B04520 [Kazachstania africana CBS 2517]CCF56749.1 hypothetical protein KAFR_0B04520 [Kazachstania africana CBS 2517]